jgi:signal transduction histidine kinase
MLALFGLARLPLRWRIAVLTGLAIALLSVAAAMTAYWVVRSSLTGNLQQALRDDALTVARIYQGATDLTPPEGPTGGVIIQLYDTQGRLVAASNEAYERLPLPVEVVVAAALGPRDWSGTLAGRGMQAALAPVGFGVVVTLAPTAFIATSLRQLSRALATTAAVLIALSAGIGYLVAAAAMRPVSRLASQAADLDPQRLTPLDYRGPMDEIGQLSRVLNDLIDRLKAAIDAQRTFLAETSHELRTPLTSLQGFLDRALRRANPEVQRELEDARRIAQGMSRLVADILQLSRGQLVQELTPHLLDAADLLQAVAEEFPGVKLQAERDVLVLGDPERLRQLLRNLVANAVRAAGDAEAVTLCGYREGGGVVLEVRDRGPGIPPEQQARIFEKFYKGPGGGAGLGLAIAKQIAELHRGTITVTSQVGLGTTFRVALPAVDENEA